MRANNLRRGVMYSYHIHFASLVIGDLGMTKFDNRSRFKNVASCPRYDPGHHSDGCTGRSPGFKRTSVFVTRCIVQVAIESISGTCKRNHSSPKPEFNSTRVLCTIDRCSQYTGASDTSSTVKFKENFDNLTLSMFRHPRNVEKCTTCFDEFPARCTGQA